MHEKTYILKYSLILFILLQFSCNKTSKEFTKPDRKKTETQETSIKLTKHTVPSESFDSFYNKFHKDSLFQLSRVTFPLKGYAMDTSENIMVWKKENWIMHKNTTQEMDTSIFKVETEKSPHLYKEKIYIEGGGYSSERVFQKVNGKWYLVQFFDQNL